jgi:hypothetical protein
MNQQNVMITMKVMQCERNETIYSRFQRPSCSQSHFYYVVADCTHKFITSIQSISKS